MNPNIIYETKSNFITIEFSESYEKALEAYQASQAKDKAIWRLLPSGSKMRIL